MPDGAFTDELFDGEHGGLVANDEDCDLDEDEGRPTIKSDQIDDHKDK